MFCHRRLKDKRIVNGELNPPGRQDLSSGVIQDRGSGLRQDSCSSTKQGDYRLSDVREVESRRFGHNDLPAAEIKYERRMLDDGTEMDDTSSESNSALPGSFYPHNRSPLNVETTEYGAPNGLIAPNKRRVGPSGYLKLRSTENAAVTAVKRQLGSIIGRMFDPLPPGAFESPSKIANTDAYGLAEPIAFLLFDIGSLISDLALTAIRNQDKYVAPTDYRSLHKSDPDSFAYRQPKQKSPFPNNGRAFPVQKSSFCADSYPARENPDYDGSVNHISSASMKPQKKRIDSRSAAVPVRHKDPMVKEDRVPPSRMKKDEELYADRRSIGEPHDSIKLKMRPTNELRAGKMEERIFGRKILASDLKSRHSVKTDKGSTELPSSFSEDETAETSSSMD
ncbi:uncharacterized protein LOC125497092 [Beta vulgaris subsp. vulgaris]|uniref:uncharacterized protein LOC125497092 n=1 Tax=Beta vulgaris subsp. vulgaris TaxID=3555 RepID=UPI002548881C|nr:uncharacterized protein LOC125497092 [Beta vulgaris subsp. vulgaris]